MTTQLVLLGTAAGPTPKRGRSAPAQAIVVGDRTYLVDCGNAVAPQLVKAGIALSSLKAVFLTHHHSDHTADFGTLALVGWSQLREPIAYYGPPPLQHMLQTFLKLHRLDIDTRTQDEGRQLLDELVEAHEIGDGGTVYEDGAVRVTAAVVHHPPMDLAFGYRFDTEDRSIVISGDTTVCDSVVGLARGADVLVHEAMYVQKLQEQVGDYRARNLLKHLLRSHTSVEDAGAVATRAGVKVLVLSHLFPADESVSDQTWVAAARARFEGHVIAGRDLLVI